MTSNLNYYGYDEDGSNSSDRSYECLAAMEIPRKTNLDGGAEAPVTRPPKNHVPGAWHPEPGDIVCQNGREEREMVVVTLRQPMAGCGDSLYLLYMDHVIPHGWADGRGLTLIRRPTP